MAFKNTVEWPDTANLIVNFLCHWQIADANQPNFFATFRNWPVHNRLMTAIFTNKHYEQASIIIRRVLCANTLSNSIELLHQYKTTVSSIKEAVVLMAFLAQKGRRA